MPYFFYRFRLVKSVIFLILSFTVNIYSKRPRRVFVLYYITGGPEPRSCNEQLFIINYVLFRLEVLAHSLDC